MKQYRKQFWMGLLIILGGLAIASRVIDWNKFNRYAGDEGIQLIEVSHMIKYGLIPISGEISSIDESGKILIHNSPWGLWLQTIPYLLGGMTPEGYTLIYVFLNMSMVIIWTYLTHKLVGDRAALIVLVFLAFTVNMISRSSWPSQPMNAIYGISGAVLLAYWGYMYRKGWLLVLAYTMGLMSIQFYPPMYLYLPWLLGGYIWIISKKINKPLIMILGLGLITIIIYAPLGYLEWKFNNINWHAMVVYLSHQDNFQVGYNFQTRLWLNYKGIITGFDFNLRRYWSWLGIIVLLFITNLLLNKSKNRGLYFWVSGFIFSSVVVASVIESYPNYVYLFPLLPFLVFLVGAAVGNLNKILYGITIASLIFSLLFWVQVDMRREKTNNLLRVRDIVRIIDNNVVKQSLDTRQVDLFVVSSGNAWNWEGPMFWYALEEKTGQRLVEIDPVSSLAIRINNKTPRGVYFICMDETGEGLNEIGCWQNFPINYVNMTHIGLNCMTKLGHEIYREKTVTVNYIPLECSAT